MQLRKPVDGGSVVQCLKWEHSYLMIHLDNERDCVVPDLCADLLPHIPITFMSARIIILDRFLRQKIERGFQLSLSFENTIL